MIGGKRKKKQVFVRISKESPSTSSSANGSSLVAISLGQVWLPHGKLNLGRPFKCLEEKDRSSQPILCVPIGMKLKQTASQGHETP